MSSVHESKGTPLPLLSAPPVEKWDDWVEYDQRAWPRKVEKHYLLVPTLCFNCEAACGLLAYIDKQTLQVQRFEGNPVHPGSRGRTCAKGPATLNQIQDPERILYPLKRDGPRGCGKWRRVSWDEALDDIGGRIRRELLANRRDTVMYHVGRPGEDGFMFRFLQAWGVDGHNSHTNVCSSSARLGYALWSGYDRPSPDYANSRFILLVSAHLESGHYFNPHAQRIIDGKEAGAEVAVIDVRLSNTASMGDHWLSTWPGSETTVLLAMAAVILKERLYDREFLRRWTNWEETLVALGGSPGGTFDDFLERLSDRYMRLYPLERAEKESGVEPRKIAEVARKIGIAGSRFSSHIWRSAASGNLGGWQVARALFFLNVLTGSVGTPGGVSPAPWDKVAPPVPSPPPKQKAWSELLFPREYPFSHFEMSFLLPHLLKEGRGKVEVYFTRCYNPVWTNPDGGSWIEALSDEKKIGLHAALTPVWNETAQWADYVLPVGLGSERHDNQSQETHAGRWIGLRQPVLLAALERLGKPRPKDTRGVNPGEVWEEVELFFDLSWRIDPDGSLGVRKFFEKPGKPGEKITADDYYLRLFEDGVPGLKETAAKQGLNSLQYMRKYGVFGLDENKSRYLLHEAAVSEGGVVVDGVRRAGFASPSKKLEIFSSTLADWGWKEHAFPDAVESHVARTKLDAAKGEVVLVPTFRLPVLVHTRTGNSKWLNEIAHQNPLWIHPSHAERLGIATGDLCQVRTRIGRFVLRAWVTEGIRPGIVACSHHFGRWRKEDEGDTNRWAAAKVRIEKNGSKLRMTRLEGAQAFPSSDADSSRVWWQESGVHQNITFPVQPDPISGMHCWHQKVTVSKATADMREGDIEVDVALGHEVFKEWLALTRPAPGPGGLRRPLWLGRPARPDDAFFHV
ncbi:molybdopterin-dependent oxidoreductase, partial [bacterium]|nr:molybdopterin-dependent oxidoreductase [bacterium]